LLAENGKLSHQFPGETSLPERLGATGARFTVAAENVARLTTSIRRSWVQAVIVPTS
jgi:uncharacterized protein YkwD